MPSGSNSDSGGQVLKPEFAVNRDGQSVADAINGFVSHAATGLVGGARLDVATAYFNVAGYALLADSLDLVRGVRLLLGAEPKPVEKRPRVLGAEPVHPARAARARLQRALEDHEGDLTTERDLLGFSYEIDAQTRRLVEWLRSDRVEVRRLEGRFLHGKAFLVGDHSHGVVAGSSNFTRAGLVSNVELNLGNYSPHVVGGVREWFDELWGEAVDYDLAGLFDARFEPHSPYLIYLRMLWERYGAELVEEASDEGAPQIHLTSFQADGLWQARRILMERHGVLVADEVGLGKTFLAGELIREAALDRRQRVLVVTPATLRDGPWRAFRAQFLLPMELISYEELMGDSRLNPVHATGHKLEAGINDYAMVVVDEAHNLRNPATQRAEALRRLLGGSPPKKLVLLTATPVNNSLWDLYHQLGFFIRNDAAFADVGIPSVRDHFAKAMALNPDDLTPEHLFDVLDAVAVRRTRSFVKRYYPNDTVTIGGREQTITFPTPRVRKVSYDLDAVLPGFFDRFAHALDTDLGPGTDSEDPEVLTLARYAPSRYRHDQSLETHEIQLAGLLRSGLLKRFESSPYAFARTCERMAESHDAFLELLDHGKVATGAALTDWMATDSDDIDSYLAEQTDLIDSADEYRIGPLRRHVARDRDLLRSFAQTARTVSRSADPNLAELVNQLADIAEQAQQTGIGPQDTRNRRKVLVFSYYADTVDWIVDHLHHKTETDSRLSAYRGRIASLSGDTRTRGKRSVVWGFAPKTTDAPEGEDQDLYDIVVTTDVLAEGVNLQQAGNIINYDLPWNPMRLVQRHGRIDRIGSYHQEVVIRCVFPDARLDQLLNLEERLHRKIKQAAASIGVSEILPEQAREDIDFTETREEIERLRREDPTLFERGGTRGGALSGEEYRQELRQAIEQGLRQQVERLPWGSGSGMTIPTPDVIAPGYVFCARIADRKQPVFRYVGPRDEGTPIADTLACLDRARPNQGPDTPRTLNDETYQGAFDAWETARHDIVEKWNHLADKANLEPRIPPALTKAADVVRFHAPRGLTQDQIDKAIDTLNAPYPQRTIRTIRAAMKTTNDPAAQASEVLDVISNLGLEPYAPPKPLPAITADDVNLICWLAVVPAGHGLDS
ncbi:MAG: helicase-related protein [bacterium]|nr:helicase-related protein [bacterium]